MHCVARRNFVRRVSIGLKVPAFVGNIVNGFELVFGRRLAADDVVWIKCGVGQAANRACCAIYRDCIRSAGHELRCGHCAGEGRRVGHADFDLAIGDSGFKVGGRGVAIVACHNRKAAAQRLCAAAAVTGEGDRFDHFAVEVAQGVTHIVGCRIACAIGFGDGVAWSGHRSVGINRCATTQSVYDGFQLADVHGIGVGCSRTQAADLVGRAVGHNTAHGGFVRSHRSEGNIILGRNGDGVARLGDGDVFAGVQGYGFARADLLQGCAAGCTCGGAGGQVEASACSCGNCIQLAAIDRVQTG